MHPLIKLFGGMNQDTTSPRNISCVRRDAWSGAQAENVTLSGCLFKIDHLRAGFVPCFWKPHRRRFRMFTNEQREKTDKPLIAKLETNRPRNAERPVFASLKKKHSLAWPILCWHDAVVDSLVNEALQWLYNDRPCSRKRYINACCNLLAAECWICLKGESLNATFACSRCVWCHAHPAYLFQCLVALERWGNW